MACRGVESWKEHTTPFERVRDVSLTVSEPRSAAHIAEEAAVSMETARRHLDSLVELTVVLKHDDADEPVYGPDPLYTRLQTARELLDAHDHPGLIELRDNLQAQIETWRDEHDVASPDALRECAAETDSVAETQDIRQTASEWELVEYRLDIATDVINDYAAYRHGESLPI